MKHQVIFGLVSTPKGEKTILQNIKNYLSTFDRTTSTAKNPDMLEKFLPFRIKNFHWNLNKDMGTFTSMFTNCDLEGKYYVKDRPDFGWLIHVIFHEHFNYEKVKSEKFVMDLLAATGCKFENIYETDDMESIKYGCV
jgi:hypothetical protein